MNKPSAKDRFTLLSQQRISSIALNKKQLHSQHSKSKTPINRINPHKQKESLDLLAQKQATDSGKDYERIKSLQYSIEDVEQYNNKISSKQQYSDNGFTDYIQVAAKTYNRKIRDFKPDLSEYSIHKTIFPDTLTNEDLAYKTMEHVPTEESKQILSLEMQKQRLGNQNRSKKREADDNEDVTFINHRNMHFNKKLSRSYDKYTTEIKASLERGTAL